MDDERVCGECEAFWDCVRAGLPEDAIPPTECFTLKVTQQRVLEVLLDVWVDDTVDSKINACIRIGCGLGIPEEDLLIAVAKKREAEKWRNANATHLLADLPDDAVLFDDCRGKFFFGRYELLETIKEERADGGQCTWRLYGCTPTKINLDSDQILQDACEDLLEDVMERIGIDAIDKLQTLLDGWTKEHMSSITTVYHPDYTTRVVF